MGATRALLTLRLPGGMMAYINDKYLAELFVHLLSAGNHADAVALATGSKPVSIATPMKLEQINTGIAPALPLPPAAQLDQGDFLEASRPQLAAQNGDCSSASCEDDTRMAMFIGSPMELLGVAKSLGAVSLDAATYDSSANYADSIYVSSNSNDDKNAIIHENFVAFDLNAGLRDVCTQTHSEGDGSNDISALQFAPLDPSTGSVATQTASWNEIRDDITMALIAELKKTPSATCSVAAGASSFAGSDGRNAKLLAPRRSKR